MTLIYPHKLSFISISTRWHSAEQRPWFAGYHLLNVDWDGDEHWLHSSAQHVGFGIETTHLKLKGLGKSLDPERLLVGFKLSDDIHRLCRHARMADHPDTLIDFAERFAACVENSLDLCDQFGGHAASLAAMSALRGESGFKINEADEDAAWEAPGLPDALAVGQYLADRNAFLWVMLIRLTLNERQVHQAQQAYLHWGYPEPPTPRHLMLGRRRKL